MLEKPNLADEEIIACLHQRYGLPVTRIEFLPIGNSGAWVYRVEVVDNRPYFLKIRQGAIAEASLTLPRYLKDQGFEAVVAPLPNQTGQLWTELAPFKLILYPFIDGQVGMEVGLSAPQWQAFGALLQRLHQTQLPPALRQQTKVETFVLNPAWTEVIQRLQNQPPPAEDTDQRDLAAFWDAHRAEIGQIVARAETLGRALQARTPEFVLCHADIHTANLLVGAAGELFIVDWDQPILAPKERDLMFVVDDAQEDQFFQGYGPAEINPLALAYYGYEWVVQEIGDYAERVFFMPELGAATRADAVAEFKALFQPGDVVAAAKHTDQQLPPTF